MKPGDVVWVKARIVRRANDEVQDTERGWWVSPVGNDGTLLQSPAWARFGDVVPFDSLTPKDGMPASAKATAGEPEERV